MASVTLRELARNTASVISAIEVSGRPALVTRNGRPVAALVPVNEAALEDWLLEHAAGYASPPRHLRGSHRGEQPR
jgi:prevent-host-death family protein